MRLGITFVGTAGIQRGKEVLKELTTAIENLEKWKREGGPGEFTEMCGCGINIVDFSSVRVSIELDERY